MEGNCTGTIYQTEFTPYLKSAKPISSHNVILQLPLWLPILFSLFWIFSPLKQNRPIWKNGSNFPGINRFPAIFVSIPSVVNYAIYF